MELGIENSVENPTNAPVTLIYKRRNSGP